MPTTKAAVRRVHLEITDVLWILVISVVLTLITTWFSASFFLANEVGGSGLISQRLIITWLAPAMFTALCTLQMAVCLALTKFTTCSQIWRIVAVTIIGVIMCILLHDYVKWGLKSYTAGDANGSQIWRHVLPGSLIDVMN